MSPALSLLLALAGPPLAEPVTPPPVDTLSARKPAPPSLELLLFVGQGMDQLPYLPAKSKAPDAQASNKENANATRLGAAIKHLQPVQERPLCVTASCSR